MPRLIATTEITNPMLSMVMGLVLSAADGKNLSGARAGWCKGRACQRDNSSEQRGNLSQPGPYNCSYRSCRSVCKGPLATTRTVQASPSCSCRRFHSGSCHGPLWCKPKIRPGNHHLTARPSAVRLHQQSGSQPHLRSRGLWTRAMRERPIVGVYAAAAAIADPELPTSSAGSRSGCHTRAPQSGPGRRRSRRLRELR